MPGPFDQLTGTSGVPTDVPTTLQQTESVPEPGELPDAENTVHAGIAAQRTSGKVREVAKELTRFGLIESARKPNLYRVLQNEHAALRAILEPLDLDVRIDDIRGIAFLIILDDESDSDLSTLDDNDPDDWSHPLVRRQRLTLEQSLLVAILRQHFVAHEQEAGIGADAARVAVDDLIPQFQVYLGDSGSEAKERSRMLTLLDQLKAHGLVSEPDTHERVTIRPIIAHLANPENLTHLLSWLRQRNQEVSTGPVSDSSTETSAATTVQSEPVQTDSPEPGLFP